MHQRQASLCSASITSSSANTTRNHQPTERSPWKILATPAFCTTNTKRPTPSRRSKSCRRRIRFANGAPEVLGQEFSVFGEHLKYEISSPCRASAAATSRYEPNDECRRLDARGGTP